MLAAFREWMRISDSPSRERSYLEALAGMRDRTLAQYPILIPDISTERVLCFEWVDGELVATRIANGSAEVVGRLAEYVLEQFCSVAAVDADFDTESMVMTPSGKLALRRANRLLAVPAPLMHSFCLKYLSRPPFWPRTLLGRPRHARCGSLWAVPTWLSKRACWTSCRIWSRS